MTKSTDSAANQKTILETGKDYLDTAVKAAKDHPAAAAGIAAGVVAAAAGAAYGAAKLRDHSVIAEDDANADIIDPQRVPEALPLDAG